MKRSVFSVVLAVSVAALAAQAVFTQSPSARGATLYEGARLIPGDGSAAIEQSALLVEGNTISAVGAKGSVKAPAGARRVDLTGKTVMPTIVNAHGHPGFQRGLTYDAKNFTKQNIADDLNRALYFGVAAVQSQGIEKGEVTYEVRADQAAGRLGGATLRIAGRGIGAPNAGPGGAAYAGIAYEVTTVEQARRAVQELAAKKVNIIKIWVDDRNGRAPRLSAELFRAIIDEGHKHSIKVNAHVFYHSDAVELVDAGIDGFAHLVRDKEMDDSLVQAIVKKNVYVMPNLSPEWSTYAELPHWLRDGDPLMTLLQGSAPPAVIERMKKTFGPHDPAATERTKAQFGILQRSLTRLAAAGAKIILGSDTGLEDHLFGMAEQRELESMSKSGMSPMQVIVAATSRPAEYLGLSSMGILAAGKDADFLVLDGNPLESITNTQRIAQVVFKGAEVNRKAMQASLTNPMD
ncbi:MAG: amidohydrolase family protein [Vicinamibacterales bacterium]